MNKYQWIYYDVWGNPEDGWEVNAAYTTYGIYTFPEDITDERVIKTIFEEDSDQVELDPHGDSMTYVFLQKEDGKPIGELRMLVA